GRRDEVRLRCGPHPSPCPGPRSERRPAGHLPTNRPKDVNMKKLLFVAALPLLFSACKQPEPPASATDPVASQEAPAPAAALPKGLVLSVPYTVISDDWTDETDSRKRKTVIEFERADAGSIGREISESMVKARYRLTG